MKHSLRWYSLDMTTGRLRKIARWMRASPYTPSRGEGFQVVAVRNDWLEAVHFHRVELTDTFEDPVTQEVTEFSRIELRRQTVRLSSVFPEVEILNPSRSQRSLLLDLANHAGKDLPLENLVVAPASWLSCLSLQRDVMDLKVGECGTSSIPLAAAVQATVVAKGTEDVREPLRAFVDDEELELEWAKVSWRIHGAQVKAHIRRDATTRFNHNTPEVRDVLRTVVQKTGERGG